jgi:hypothetical protein
LTPRRHLIETAAWLFIPLLAWPAIALRIVATPGGSDQIKNHLRVIDGMTQSFPWIQIADYPAAAAPGYHILMAALASLFHLRPEGLQFVSSVFGAVLVVVALRLAMRWVSGSEAAFLMLPLAASTYVIGSSVWLVTDNPGWLCAFVSLGLLVGTAPLTTGRLLLSGGVAAVAVAIRQVEVWLVVPIALAAIASGARARWPLAAWAGAAVAVAAPLVPGLWLLSVWHGLTPPSFESIYVGAWNPTAFAVTLALFGAFGVAFGPVLGLGPRADRRVLAAAGAAGLLLALAVPSTYDDMAGRWGGLIWSLVQRGPTVGSRSIPLIVLAAIGAAILARAVLAARARGRGGAALVLTGAIVAFAAAQSLTQITFERYFDPIVLAALGWLCALSLRPRLPRWRWIVLGLLGAAQIAVSIESIYFRPASLRPVVEAAPSGLPGPP